jgi:hypothetical protein
MMTDQHQTKLSLEQVLDIVTKAYADRRIVQTVRRDGQGIVSTIEVVIDEGTTVAFNDALGLIGVALV